MSEQASAVNTEGRELVVFRVIDAPVEQVWKAWSEPEYVKQWWGPDGFTCPVANLDFREGGTSHVAESSPDFGTHYSIWAYREIVPHQRIEYIQNLADEAGNTVDPVSAGMPPDFPQDVRNVVTLRSIDGDKTELSVTEYAEFSDQWYELSKVCLEQLMDKLVGIFAKD